MLSAIVFFWCKWSANKSDIFSIKFHNPQLPKTLKESYPGESAIFPDAFETQNQ